MPGKDSSHSFGMTMRVISNKVRDPSLIPFSKERTKSMKEIRRAKPQRREEKIVISTPFGKAQGKLREKSFLTLCFSAESSYPRAVLWKICASSENFQRTSMRNER